MKFQLMLRLLQLTLFTHLLYGFATAGEAVRYRDFGAAGDGRADDFAALERAHAHANKAGLPVVADDDATYYIGGADRTIVVKTSTDFGEATFIIDDTRLENAKAHVFEVRSRQTKIQLQGIQSLKRNQARIEADLPGPCLVRVADQGTKRFIRRGGNQNKGHPQTDVFLVDKHGKVDPATPIIWEFKQITEIEALPLDEEPLTLRGGRFTTIANQAESTYNYHARGLAIRRSNVVVEGLEHRIRGEGETGAPYSGFINISECANIMIRNTLLSGHKTYKTIGSAGKTVSMGSYDILLGRAVNVSLVNVTQSNDIMDRSRWGVIGTNFCKNLLYDGCKLSRFDAHMGVTHAAIRNSTLGHMGVKLTGFGTFTIENTTVQSRNFITLRSDYGSTWNGDIVIRNCRFIPHRGNSSPAILNGYNDGRHDFGYTCHLPKQLTIDNLYIEDSEPTEDDRGPVIFGDFNPRFQAGETLPHPQVITEQVVNHGVTTSSGKKLRLSENPALFRDVKVLER